MERAQTVSESELIILRVLWARQEPILLAPLMEILLAQGNQWKTNTVLTFLTRLAEKGMVRISKVGRLNQYAATLSEADYMASLTRDFVSSVYGGNTKGLIASLIRNEHLSRQDMDELRTYWEEAKGDA